MRKLQWQKISANAVYGKNNVWTKVGGVANGCRVDFDALEELFTSEKDGKDADGGSRADGAGSAAAGGPRRKRELAEVNILDQRASLKVNIFLKQFRLSHAEIVQLVRDGRSKDMGAEKLRGLLKVLPEQEEIEALKNYNGDVTKLASAEQFYHHLLSLPFYKLRTEIMLLREEFAHSVGWISEALDTIIVTAQDIKESKVLQEILYLVLVTGNFLNAGAYPGDAAGFKLTSLLKLTEMRSNKPRMNLLHVVVMQAEKRNPKLLGLPDEMKYLKNTADINTEALTGDIKGLQAKLASYIEQLESASADMRAQFMQFLTSATQELVVLERDIRELETVRLELVEYFAEDSATFKLEECFNIMRTFTEKFRRAVHENKQRELLEKKQQQRQLQKAEQQQHGSGSRQSTSGRRVEDDNQSASVASSEDEGHIVNSILGDIRSGFIQKKNLGDAAFHVAKVKKVTLDSSGGSAGQGSPASSGDALDGTVTLKTTRDSAPAVDAAAASTVAVADAQKHFVFQKAANSGAGDGAHMLASLAEEQENSPSASPAAAAAAAQDGSNVKRRSRVILDDDEELIEFLSTAQALADREKERGTPEGAEGEFARQMSLRRRRGQRRIPTSLSLPNMNQREIAADTATVAASSASASAAGAAPAGTGHLAPPEEKQALQRTSSWRARLGMQATDVSPSAASGRQSARQPASDKTSQQPPSSSSSAAAVSAIGSPVLAIPLTAIGDRGSPLDGAATAATERGPGLVASASAEKDPAGASLLPAVSPSTGSGSEGGGSSSRVGSLSGVTAALDATIEAMERSMAEGLRLGSGAGEGSSRSGGSPTGSSSGSSLALRRRSSYMDAVSPGRRISTVDSGRDERGTWNLPADRKEQRSSSLRDADKQDASATPPAAPRQYSWRQKVYGTYGDLAEAGKAASNSGAGGDGPSPSLLIPTTSAGSTDRATTASLAAPSVAAAASAVADRSPLSPESRPLSRLRSAIAAEGLLSPSAQPRATAMADVTAPAVAASAGQWSSQPALALVGKEADVTANVLHALRARREEQEERPLHATPTTSQVGSRISSRFKDMYTAVPDEDEAARAVLDPPVSSLNGGVATAAAAAGSPKEEGNQTDSGFETKSECASVRTSYSSGSHVDMIDSLSSTASGVSAAAVLLSLSSSSAGSSSMTPDAEAAGSNETLKDASDSGGPSLSSSGRGGDSRKSSMTVGGGGSARRAGTTQRRSNAAAAGSSLTPLTPDRGTAGGSGFAGSGTSKTSSAPSRPASTAGRISAAVAATSRPSPTPPQSASQESLEQYESAGSLASAPGRSTAASRARTAAAVSRQSSSASSASAASKAVSLRDSPGGGGASVAAVGGSQQRSRNSFDDSALNELSRLAASAGGGGGEVGSGGSSRLRRSATMQRSQIRAETAARQLSAVVTDRTTASASTRTLSRSSVDGKRKSSFGASLAVSATKEGGGGGHTGATAAVSAAAATASAVATAAADDTTPLLPAAESAADVASTTAAAGTARSDDSHKTGVKSSFLKRMLGKDKKIVEKKEPAEKKRTKS